MTTAAKYPTDRQLASDLIYYRQSQGLTNKHLAQRFGESITFISKYLNDKLDRDPKDFAARTRNALTAILSRLEDATILFETSVSQHIAGRIEAARRTQDVLLIFSDAGEGKTSGGKLFAQANPGTIYLELSSDERSDEKVAGALFAQLERRNDWKGNTSRSSFLKAQLRGSHRVLIIDEAHLLDFSGRQFCFNLNRDTGCAVVMIGNPILLDKIRRHDQHFSRVGVKGNPKLTDEEIPAVARRVAAQFSSQEFADEIEDLAAYVATRPGRLRAVRKQVILAFDLAGKNGYDPRRAFREAHRNLVRDYALPSD